MTGGQAERGWGRTAEAADVRVTHLKDGCCPGPRDGPGAKASTLLQLHLATGAPEHSLFDEPRRYPLLLWWWVGFASGLRCAMLTGLVGTDWWPLLSPSSAIRTCQ